MSGGQLLWSVKVTKTRAVGDGPQDRRREVPARLVPLHPGTGFVDPRNPFRAARVSKRSFRTSERPLRNRRGSESSAATRSDGPTRTPAAWPRAWLHGKMIPSMGTSTRRRLPVRGRTGGTRPPWFPPIPLAAWDDQCGTGRLGWQGLSPETPRHGGSFGVEWGKTRTCVFV
jgi:hypothetical protein